MNMSDGGNVGPHISVCHGKVCSVITPGWIFPKAQLNFAPIAALQQKPERLKKTFENVQLCL